MDDNTFINCIVAAAVAPVFSLLWWVADLLACRNLQAQKIRGKSRARNDL